VAAAIKEHRPALSIDTTKKELVGEYANGGREWRPKGDPVAVNVHDFPDKALGKAIPYGIYDIGANNGFVNVGITKETAAFAVTSIRSWWQQLGPRPLPERHDLAGHRRLRRRQRPPRLPVEDRAVAPRRRHRT
jgi:hypothetical protein